jgi:hypothetical protein
MGFFLPRIVFYSIYLRKKIMKIKSLFFALCMVVASANAQFTFLDIAGASVESGTVVSFGQGQVGNPAGYYESSKFSRTRTR